MRRTALVTSWLAGLGLLVAVGSASAASPDLVGAAEKEGSVVWYTGLIVNQVVRPIVSAFQAKYPAITVNAARYPAPEAVLKVTSEAQAGRPIADIVDNSTALYTLQSSGLLQSYHPEAAAKYPDALKDKDGYWTACNLYFMVPAVNTTQVSKAEYPGTFEKLLDPKWRGKIAWTTDPTTVGAPGFIYTVLQTMGEEKGTEYLKKLAAQKIANVPASQRVVLDKVISGEFAIGLMTFNNHSVITAAKGAPIEWVKLEPVVEAANIVGIVKGAPHPNAAKLLLEFILSDEGQEIMKKSEYIPASPDVQAQDPKLKPEAGGFKTRLLGVEAQGELRRMIGIYETTFK